MGKFHDIALRDLKRSIRLEKKLVEFVKEHDNFIDMRNIDYKNDNCYGIIYDLGMEESKECRVLALTTDDNNLKILVTDVDDGWNYHIGSIEASFNDMSKEEMLKQHNDWFYVTGELVWRNATLIEICSCVEQYV